VPAATPPPATAAATPGQPVVAHAGHRSILVPALLLAIALIGAAALAASALAGRRSPGVRHAWREAAYRTRGTWADFSDWLRLGR
jgi:CBS-domain-containing membrane protein